MMKKIIPLSRPDITKAEREAVLDVLKTPVLALGPKLNEFEKMFARYIGTKYAVAVNSGTSGLHLALKSLDIKEGDEIITTPFSFVASANCILYEKASPVFVDVEEKDYNIDPDKIEKAITRKTKAMVIVDVFGQPAEWKKISRIAKNHGLKIIEDSCEALGAEYLGKKCGRFGDAGVFAFYPNKQITTGEGGIVVTNSKRIADFCRSSANQGRKIEKGKWLEHVRLGYNYRMSEINAALGIAQMKRLESILKARNKVASTYNRVLKGISGIETPSQKEQTKISWFVYVVLLSKSYTRKDRDEIIKEMGRKNIQCADYFQCIHLQPFYQKEHNFKKGMFPVAESISARTIALPFYNNLKDQEIAYIVQSLQEAIFKVKK